MLNSPLILPLGLHSQVISDTNKHKGWPTGYCDDLLEAGLNFQQSLFSVDYTLANAKLALTWVISVYNHSYPENKAFLQEDLRKVIYLLWQF